MEPNSSSEQSNPKSAPLNAALLQNKTAQTEGISVKEFLDFLKLAYQVHDSVEGVLLTEGNTEAVDWIKLKETELAKPKGVAIQTSDCSLSSDCSSRREAGGKAKELPEPIRQKLTEVLNEGILDSVLPYMVPPISAAQTHVSRKSSQKSQVSLIGSTVADVNVNRLKSDSSVSAVARTDSEVVIHVCDEVKNTKKDFVCDQVLLVDKMGYFADITAGQRLEDLDISVHCDITIFEWLMRWVKQDRSSEEERPQLQPGCVIPILVSAAFLQMEPLLQDCLLFCHEHMNEILRTSTSLSCLNDLILSRLAAMYTNAEIEAIRDRKDKILSKLYFKLIQALCEPDPEPLRGHWASLARTYRCDKCQQLVAPSVGHSIPCVPARMSIQCDGSVVHEHARDPSWNVNRYVEGLHRQLRTWRKVYWRLWGDAHHLYCTACRRYFPANQIGWCRYHPDAPQFFTVDAQKAPLPVGRYPCCGERAYRFELLKRESGCQFREHVPAADDVTDTSILALLETSRSLVEEEPPKVMYSERLTRLTSKAACASDAQTSEGLTDKGCTFWWAGLKLVPPRPQLGLLGAFSAANAPAPPPPPPPATEETVTEPPNDTEYCSDISDSTSSPTSSSSSPNVDEEEEEEEEEHYRPAVTPKSKFSPRTSKVAKRRNGRLWQSDLSARSNQDMQRGYEEAAQKKMSAILSRRTLSTVDPGRFGVRTRPRHVTPPGGIWVRLEGEWRDANSVPQPQRANNRQQRVKATRINN